MTLAATDDRGLLRAIGASSLILLATNGCVHVDQTLTLARDGSGSIDLFYAQPDESSTQVQALARRILEQAGAEDSMTTMPLEVTDDQIRKEFKALAPYGITLHSVKTESRDGWTVRNMNIRFRHLKGLAEAGLLADRDISLARDAAGNYVFTQSAGRNSTTSEALALLAEMESTPLMGGLMQGFRARLRVITPGRILETNAPEKTERAAAWTFDYDRDPGIIGKAHRLAMRIVFDGKGLAIPDFRSISD